MGADVLRAGGNAVDAAVAAVLASFATEPLLTGLGAGGYMLVVPPAGEPALLDFFVEAPGQGAHAPRRAELLPIRVSFGDAVQVFNVGPASCGAYGTPSGLCEAAARYGSMALGDLVGPAVALARDGVELTREQAYVLEILEGVVRSTPECGALFAPAGRRLRVGETFRSPELAEALARLGREGAAPFYRGDIAAAAVEWLGSRGGTLTADDLAGYRTVVREPVRVDYRGRTVLTNPPPSAGGVLIALALALLEDRPSPPSLADLVAAMERTQQERTPEFLARLAEPGFAVDFLRAVSAGSGGAGGTLGSTTHVSVLDGDGGACSVTCSNGSSSGVVVPGTGLHLNNMMGEQDLNPLGFHRHAPGRRMPSMMAPTIVLAGATPELVLGSAGSNRIRSAILQVTINVVDRGMRAGPAVRAPRVHCEDGVVYAEPGLELAALEAEGRAIARFGAPNLFFGGAQAAERDADSGALSGGGDPRRGGAAVVV